MCPLRESVLADIKATAALRFLFPVGVQGRNFICRNWRSELTEPKNTSCLAVSLPKTLSAGFIDANHPGVGKVFHMYKGSPLRAKCHAQAGLLW